MSDWTGPMILGPLEAACNRKNLVVTEGIASVWHYHLSEAHWKSRALCGKQAMPTNIPVRTWGFKPDHMPSSYCRVCETKALEP
jgi:hypothetical protein